MHTIQKWLNDHKALVYWSIGLCFCLCLTLAPDILSALLEHKNSVWTPVNSPLYRGNDSYYYAAWVAEGIRNGFPSGSPSAAEYVNKSLVETIRWFPLAVAALPSFLFSDFRIVYVSDYVFTVFMLFGIPFYLTYRFTKSSLGSLLIGVLVLFYSGMSWNVFAVFKLFLSSLSDREDLPSFRYINLSISGPILMTYILLCHLLYAKTQRNYIIAGAIFLLSPFMAFSYPSHAFIAYVALGGYASLAYLRGHKHSAVMLLIIGLLTASTLILGGYPNYVQQTFAANQLWINIFNNESLILIDRPYWVMIRMAFLNKYTISLFFVLWLAWKNRELRDMIILFGGMGVLFKLTELFDMPLLSVRFRVRGIDQLWLTIFAIACLWGWKKRVKPWISSHTILYTADLLEVVTFLLILTLPTLGLGNLALRSVKNSTYFMSQERWDVLKWVDMNVPNNDTIATLDWDDITFIPIYTHAKLVVDNMIIGGRGPADELRRYAALWKILGFPREKLELRITKMIEVASQWQNLPTETLINLPLLDPESYATRQIATAMIYWPYVKKVWGIDVVDGNKTSTSLTSRVMMLYDSIDAKSAVKEYQVSMVLLSGIEQNFPLKTKIPLKQVFKNKTHTIYRVLN